MAWTMKEPALQVAKQLEPLSDGRLPHEVLRIKDDISSIVIDIAGRDYILTMLEIPKQRERPAQN